MEGGDRKDVFFYQVCSQQLKPTIRSIAWWCIGSWSSGRVMTHDTFQELSCSI